MQTTGVSVGFSGAQTIRCQFGDNSGDSSVSTIRCRFLIIRDNSVSVPHYSRKDALTPEFFLFAKRCSDTGILLTPEFFSLLMVSRRGLLHQRKSA